MTFEEMIAEFRLYETNEAQVAQYSVMLDRLLQSGGDDVAYGFHERTVARLAGLVTPVQETQAPVAGEGEEVPEPDHTVAGEGSEPSEQ